MVLGLTFSSIILLIAYLFISLYLYRKDTNIRFDLKNHFPFEIYSNSHQVNGPLNFLLFISFLTFSANAVVLLVKGISVNSIVITIAVTLSSVLAVLLFYIPLANFKKHAIIFIGLLTCSIIINALLFFMELERVKDYEQYLFIVPMVVNGLLIAIYIAFAFHPSLFKLKLKDGNRPKYFVLSICEWAVIISVLFAQISFLFFAIIK